MQEILGVTKILHIATLNGLLAIGFGTNTAVMWGNNEASIKAAAAAGTAYDEIKFQIPMGSLDLATTSTLTDVLNVPLDQVGPGVVLAMSSFLRHWIEPGTQWVHIDMAGASIPTLSQSGFGASLLAAWATAPISVTD
jgi:leucyl aminopeptidase